mmetsp:Transcript_8309/g.24468  ORF Transcript_8309/g.24468 Transcript_8309/m.24468 type:complete len:302 (-) Transcript_8309:2-907(-)
MMSYASSFSSARKPSGGFDVVGVPSSPAPSARQSSQRTFVVFSSPSFPTNSFLLTDSSNASNRGASKSDNTTSFAPNLAAANPTNPTPAPSSSTVLSFTSIPTPLSPSPSSLSSSNCSANNNAAFHNFPPTPFDSFVSKIDTSTRPSFMAYVFALFFFFRYVSKASTLFSNKIETSSWGSFSSFFSHFLARTFSRASLTLLSASATSASSPYVSSSLTLSVRLEIAFFKRLSEDDDASKKSSSSFSSTALSMTSNHSPTRSPATSDAYQSPSSANSSLENDFSDDDSFIHSPFFFCVSSNV